MQIFKTVVTNGTTILPIDTLSYGEDGLCVPHWIATVDGLCLTPDRISDAMYFPRENTDHHDFGITICPIVFPIVHWMDRLGERRE